MSSSLVDFLRRDGFLPGGHLPVDADDRILPVANSLLPLYPQIAVTQDWHPPGHQSFASRSPPATRPIWTFEPLPSKTQPKA